MSAVEKVHRRNLNEGQREVLKLLFAFRYATAAQIGKSQGHAYPSVTHARLKRLLEQGYIERRFEPKFHMMAQPAIFYLSAKGMRVLEEEGIASSEDVRGAYKNKRGSMQLMSRHISVYDMYHWLRDSYGDRVQFFTKKELTDPDYAYFPQPLPDGYFLIEGLGAGERDFILDVYPETRPIFTAMARLKMYTEYVKSGEWGKSASGHPVFVGIFNTEAQQNGVHKRLSQMLKSLNVPDFQLLTTTNEQIKTTNAQDAIWQNGRQQGEQLRLDQF